jgi:hypothetical protein
MGKMFWCGVAATLAVSAGICWWACRGTECPNSLAARIAERLLARTGATATLECSPGNCPASCLDADEESDEAIRAKALRMIDLSLFSEGLLPPFPISSNEESEEPPNCGMDNFVNEDLASPGERSGGVENSKQFPKTMPYCTDEESVPTIMPYAERAELFSPRHGWWLESESLVSNSCRKPCSVAVYRGDPVPMEKKVESPDERKNRIGHVHRIWSWCLKVPCDWVDATHPEVDTMEFRPSDARPEETNVFSIQGPF